VGPGVVLLWRSSIFLRFSYVAMYVSDDRAIVCKVGHMLICCTGAGTHNFQIASERLQYRLKRHVLGHIRPPSTLQNFQYSIETIFAF